jgi:photosystem II stability/assembly factor-like uncharacterized protein
MPATKSSAKAKTVSVLVGTRKGAFVLSSNSKRTTWKQSDPIFLGHIIHHFMADTRTPGVMLMAAKTGHLGPTVFRSTDGGATWTESSKPPAFPKVEPVEGEKGRVVERVFWLTQGHDSEPGVWYTGTAPAGLFISRDNGDTWESVSGFNDNPMYPQWSAGGTPDGLFLHSILIDPRDPNHMYLGISVGGIFESTDKGASWTPLNKGVEADWLPDPETEFGHDPHCIVYHPAQPDRLYHQNHCGIYKIDRPSKQWIRIGKNMPEGVGDIGFPIVVHPEHVDTAWVFPMDGTEVWPRTSPEGKPAVYVTKNGGDTWKRQDRGLPRKQAYLTVKRQAMTTDKQDSVGLYFGTTGGEVWASADEGANWECIARHLPEVYSLSVFES